jgi:hypothetical protein
VKPATRRLLLLGGCLLCGWLALRGSRDQPAPPAAQSLPAADAPLPRSHSRLAAEWQEWIARCEQGGDPAEFKKQLAALKDRWLEEDPQVLAGIIGQLLRQGGDAPTGIPFETGPGGALRGWPTLRVFLLDTLAVTDPDLAGVIAREILATTTSAEEFAVALKPLLLGGPWQAPAGELEAHFTRLLENPEWQDKTGLAEALDLSRIAASPGSTQVLARWVDRSPPAKEAGVMALHETAANHPSLVIGLVAEDPQLFQDQPELRAGLLARAAASDPQQTERLGDYLKDPSVSLAEKQHFLGLFPLRSASTGFRLYGSPPAPYDAASVKADDKAALGIVNQWKADPAMSELRNDFAGLEQRLLAWVGQTGD